MASYADLERFYLDLVQSLRGQGVTCAVTSGMACVAWGVSPSTQDCDILVQPDGAERLTEHLVNSRFEGFAPNFRGSLSPPLDSKWLQGGWTCHFHWEDLAFLDVSGVPPRQGQPWQDGIAGAYASVTTVAEMKWTARAKDWPLTTALGLKLLAAGDSNGWMFLADPDVLTELLATETFPAELVKRRPLLELAMNEDVRLAGALVAEQLYLQQLDRQRIQIYQKAVRPYSAAVKDSGLLNLDLLQQQAIRRELAEQYLPARPLHSISFLEYIDQARSAVAAVVQPALLDYLPDVRAIYGNLFD
ncbi:hypothetical protein JST97_06205 [bacterium]|nr:hypothetical protein [bacterium]